MSEFATLTIQASPEFIRLLAQEMVKMQPAATVGRTKPYNVDEFAKAIGVSAKTIRRRIEAKLIRTVPDVGRVMIPASEFERLTGGDGR